jgi:hypothetical protein
MKNVVFWDVIQQPLAHAGSSRVDFSTLKMEVYVPPKRQFTQDLHGATTQKTAFFIVTPMKTSNRTQWLNHCYIMKLVLTLCWQPLLNIDILKIHAQCQICSLI